MKLNTKKITGNLILGLIILLPFNFAYISNFAAVQNLLFFSEPLKYSFFLFDALFLILLIFWLKEKLTTRKLLFSRDWFLITIYLIFSSLLIASNPKIAFYNASRILEVILFFCIFIDTIKTKNLFNKALYLIFLSGVIQSLIALLQFIFQKSLGLKYLGESLLSPSILGVAKIEVAREKFIRGYGTFPHPNLLGAFLFLALLAGFYFILNRNLQIPFSLPEKIKILRLKKPTKNLLAKIHFFTGSLIISTGIITTFSRSVWLVTALLILGIIIFRFKPLFSKKYLFKQTLLTIVILMAFWAGFARFVPARICTGNCQDQSLTLRQNYSEFAKTVIAKNLIFGIGPGQFITTFKEQNPTNLPDWDIQPVHNLYLMILSELGFVGFLLLFGFIFKNISPGKNLFSILVGSFLILGFFDHYFWTLPQGQFIFWLSLALLASSGRIDK